MNPVHADVKEDEPAFKVVELTGEELREFREGFAELEANEKFLEAHWKTVERVPDAEVILAVKVGDKRVCKTFASLDEARVFCETHAPGLPGRSAAILPLDF